MGIPEHDYTRVIREDPVRRGLLYVGTETGVYVSFDDGTSWQPAQANLPTVPVYDLAIKDDDLIAATHGRSFWILDDLTQLRQITPDLGDQPFRLMQPRTTYRLPSPFRARKPTPGKNYQLSLGAAVAYTETKGVAGETIRTFLDAGENAPSGVIVTYYLGEPPQDDVTLSFLNAKGERIESFSSRLASDEADEADKLCVPAEAGVNRFIWDMRYPPAHKVPGDKTTEEKLSGPLVSPGTYQVSLHIGDVSQTQSFEIIKDPRVTTTPTDFEAQFELLIRIRDKVSETHDAINSLRSIRRQVEEWEQRAEGSTSAETVSNAANALKDRLAAIEGELIQVDFKGARDRLNLPAKLNDKLTELTSVVGAADFAPPKQAYDVFDDLVSRIDPQLQQLEMIIDEGVTQFTTLVHELGIPAIVPRTT